MRAPTATTRLAGVIGDPVEHSLSPTLHNAAFEALGLDWVYVAFPVPAGQGAAAVAAVRTLGLAGLSVTMPHKAEAARAVDRLTPVAERLGVINTVVVRGHELIGDSTDGAGFVDSLRHEGFDPDGRRCVVLGTGGAARAVALALGAAGAGAVIVVGRSPEAAAAGAGLAGRAGRIGTVDEVAAADLIVNATPIGMTLPVRAPGPDPAVTQARAAAVGPAFPLGLEVGRLGPGQLVVDLIYAPALTPLLLAARRQGATAVNGLGMLLHQAGRQVEAWTGVAPPLDVMAAAVRSSLDARTG
jgi:shikimate dehydrogenase